MNMMTNAGQFLKSHEHRAFGSPESTSVILDQLVTRERKASKSTGALLALETENARRIPCPYCELGIHPENLTRHIWCVHLPLEEMFDANGDAINLEA